MTSGRPPNVIVVLTDDQGYPPIGANGRPYVRTPHLDRFHDEAVRLEQFHSGATRAPTTLRAWGRAANAGSGDAKIG
jgi:arylsulfatase A-like enzyme